jgi:hypothetical protein
MVNRETISAVGVGLKVHETPAATAAATAAMTTNGTARLHIGIGRRTVTPWGVSTIAG